MSTPLLDAAGVPIDRSFTRAIAGQEIKSIEKQLRGSRAPADGDHFASTAARLLKRTPTWCRNTCACVDDQDLARRLSLFIEAAAHAHVPAAGQRA